VAGTQNRYAEPPFLQDGIGCERCHGPGEKHVQTMSGRATAGRSEIINPAKLDTRRRDSVCEQCHLTGEARIARPGRSLSMFRPGDLLSDFVVSFVARESGDSLPVAGSVTATSHVEKFWQSRCKKESGDRLWCGTCHDAHSVPQVGSEREYFRKKCLNCHQVSGCAASPGLRAASKDDCAGCHMPKNRVADGGHGVLTDHTITRATRLVAPRREARAATELVPFRGAPAGERERGLAHAEVGASAGDRAHSSRAFELLERAMKNDPKDSTVLYRLAFLYEQKGDAEQAARLYGRALEIDPSLVVAMVNLANHHARKGNLQQALRLWQDALGRNPALEEARLNLAMAYAQAGDIAAARSALLKALEFNPDSPLARRLQAELR
jgi:Flp pilus assembly protein TadD